VLRGVGNLACGHRVVIGRSTRREAWKRRKKKKGKGKRKKSRGNSEWVPRDPEPAHVA
jgi:hypothetical protein